jgi:hypothetical protein
MKEAINIPYKDCKTKRGALSFDFETRPDFSDYVWVKHQKTYRVKDTICCICFRYSKSFDYHKMLFTTNKEKSSARQLLDWLKDEQYDGHHFNTVAHFGSIFDNHLLIAAMTAEEQYDTPIQLRNASVIGMQWYSHLIKCSACFLTASLESLCDSYKIETKKLTTFTYQGKQLSNMNSCMFKPSSLTFGTLWFLNKATRKCGLYM